MGVESLKPWVSGDVGISQHFFQTTTSQSQFQFSGHTFEEENISTYGKRLIVGWADSSTNTKKTSTGDNSDLWFGRNGGQGSISAWVPDIGTCRVTQPRGRFSENLVNFRHC